MPARLALAPPGAAAARERQGAACAIDEDKAQLLGVAKGTPALRVLRRYRDGGGALVVVTRSLYPENRDSITTTLLRTE